jgi:xanthine/CO dehydrogenase XdhC/CoxF family maturation factor
MEIYRLFNQLKELTEVQKDSLALATVVGVRGSSYRSTGARMLITRDGHWYGTISGGCLEGDALRKAREVMHSQKPMLVTYDTNETAHQELKISLGCNGIIDVLIEPFDPNGAKAEILGTIASSDQLQILSTVITPGYKLGEQVLYDDQGKITGQPLSTIHKDYLQLTSQLRQPGKFSVDTDTGSYDILIEVIEPRIDLLVFGGGFDARPVIKLADFLGWKASVFDACAAHLIPKHFEKADSLVSCKKELLEQKIIVKPYSAAVLMSHNYDYDRDALKALSKTSIAYVGMLGPRKRLDKMIDELKTQDCALNQPFLDRVHSPIGLDIGAETPEEIAIAILSEIQAFFKNKKGSSLKYKNGPIHDREGDDEVFRNIFNKDQIKQ